MLKIGSVKDVVMDDSRAGKWYRPPQPHEFGTGVFRVSGRFSVEDLKGLIPQDLEIPGKDVALAIIASNYMEHLENLGIPTCYMGILDKNGTRTTVSELLRRGEVSNLVLMRLANTPEKPKEETLEAKKAAVAAYHKATQDADISVYVGDTELIYRAGVPLGSSVFKKIFKLMGKEEVYAKLATYDETVKELDTLRLLLSLNSFNEFHGPKEHLSSLELHTIPNPGAMLPNIVFNYTTKFDPAGDKDLSEAQAMQLLALAPEQFVKVKDLYARVVTDEIDYAKARGINAIDGKAEIVIGPRKVPFITDFVLTPDENRLMIAYKRNGTVYLLPTDKELQRIIFRREGISAKIAEAKMRYGDDWQQHFIGNFVSRSRFDEVARASTEYMSDAIKEVANRLLGRRVFDVKPLETWVDALLPYASRVQK